jgi:ferredoxin
MNIPSVELVYFSPTMTTKHIVESIAKGIQDGPFEHIDLTPPTAKKQEFEEFHSELAIVGTPVYGGRVPIDAISRLQRLKAHNTPAVVVVVYGNRAYDDALLELKTIASEIGFKPIAGGAFIGEHSFSTGETPIASGRPDVKDIEKAVEFGKKIRERIEKTKDLEDIPSLHVSGNYPYMERQQLGAAFPIVKEELCNMCGKCAEVCPTATITLATTVTIKQDTCIECFACVKNCPTNAIIFENPILKEVAKWLSTNYSERKEPEIYL